MRNVLLHLDVDPIPSVFDQVVACDAGAEIVIPAGGVTQETVADLVHGIVFTRDPPDLHHSAIFVGGSDHARAREVFRAVQAAMFGEHRVSVLFDPNGSNTTAAAALAALAGVGAIRGKRCLVLAGTGPVGRTAALLLAREGADVTITSRRLETAREAVSGIQGVAPVDNIAAGQAGSPEEAAALYRTADVVLSAGKAGVEMLPEQTWAAAGTGTVLLDLNAVPPAGIGGVGAADDGTIRHGAVCFGALGIGKRKMRIHRACIARLFEPGPVVLDTDEICELGRRLG